MMKNRKLNKRNNVHTNVVLTSFAGLGYNSNAPCVEVVMADSRFMISAFFLQFFLFGLELKNTFPAYPKSLGK